MLAGHTFQLTDIHLFFVSEFVHDASLDVEKQALLMVGDVALAGSDEVVVATVADGAFLAELVFDIEVDS